METEAAKTLATLLVGHMMPRFNHVSEVAAVAQSVASRLRISRDMLVSAAWLHDIGYAPSLVDTGFHPLDGARFLRNNQVSEQVVNLVAHHSYASVEAELRGLGDELESEFPKDDTLPHDALCYCDMTTGPNGEGMAVRERLNEIRLRYGRDNIVSRFIDRAEPDIVKTVVRVEKGLAEAAQSR